MSTTDELIAKANKIWEEGLADLTEMPVSNDRGLIVISPQELQKLIKDRCRLAWADGVFCTLGSVGYEQQNQPQKQ